MLVCLQAISHPRSPGAETGKLLQKLLRMVTIADTPWSFWVVFFCPPGLFRPAALLLPSSTPPLDGKRPKKKKKNPPSHLSRGVQFNLSRTVGESFFFPLSTEAVFVCRRGPSTARQEGPKATVDENIRAWKAGSRGNRFNVQRASGSTQTRCSCSVSLSLPPSITSAER